MTEYIFKSFREKDLLQYRKLKKKKKTIDIKTNVLHLDQQLLQSVIPISAHPSLSFSLPPSFFFSLSLSHTHTHTQCISTVIKFYESNTESHGVDHMDRRVYEEFLERQKRATVINSLGGAFTLGTSLILCYRSPWGTTYIPQARDKLSIRLLLIVCVILDITEPKEKQHTHQNPCIYNHLLFSCSVMSDSLQPHGL